MYRIRLIAPRSEERPDGGVSYLGWPVMPDYGWVCQFSPNLGVSSPERALEFDTPEIAMAVAQRNNLGLHYEFEVVECSASVLRSN